MKTSSPNPVVHLENVRLSYPAIFTPKPDQNPTKPAKYEASFILDKKVNAADIAAVRVAIETTKKHEKLKGKKPTKVCLRDGADTDARAEAEGYGPDVMSISSRNDKRPAVVNRDLTPLTAEDGKPYAGCYVNATIEVYPYIHKESGPGIAASLRAIQFYKDGEPFGGGVPVDPEKEFQRIEEEESPI